MKSIFLAVLIFLTFKVTAQNDSSLQAKKEITHRFYIGAEGGPSFPLSDFGDRNLENPKAGAGLTGLCARLRAGYEVSKGFIVVADGIWFYNPLDAKTLLNSVTSNQNNPVAYKYKVTTNAWQVYGGMAGAAWRFDLDDTDCELKGLLGLVKGNFASALYSANALDTTYFIDQSADGGVAAFAANIGITFRIKISEKIGLTVSGDYFVTEFNYDNVKYTYYKISNSNNMRIDDTVENAGSYKQPVSVFQVSAGLSFKF